MLGTYYYHEIIRKAIIGFGTLFNDINIRHEKIDDTTLDQTKVGLAYGPQQKFFAKIREQENLTKPIAITLPRMSFEMNTIAYDPTRKAGVTQTFKTSDGTNLKKVYMPVPYNIGFELSIFTKLNDDALQIVEQILPYFQPSYNLSVNLVGSINEKRDIPVILENITMQDDYEGDFESRRVLLYTLRFTAKTYLFGPVTDASKDIITKSTVNYLTGTDTSNAQRNLTYSVVPRAIQNYDGTVLTNLAADITKTQTVIELNDVTNITASSGSTSVYLDIGGEEVYVKSKDSDTNKITVKRGQDGTTKLAHIGGTEVKSITSADNVLVEEGDDFGFSGTITGD